MIGCGPTILPADLAGQVDRGGNPANPWRVWIPTLINAVILARTKRDALAVMAAPGWADRVCDEAFRQDRLCEAPCPPQGRARGSVWGTWDPCEPSRLPDAQRFLICDTGPRLATVRGRDLRLWLCSADDLAHAPPDLPPIVHAPR